MDIPRPAVWEPLRYDKQAITAKNVATFADCLFRGKGIWILTRLIWPRGDSELAFQKVCVFQTSFFFLPHLHFWSNGDISFYSFCSYCAANSTLNVFHSYRITQSDNVRNADRGGCFTGWPTGQAHRAIFAIHICSFQATLNLCGVDKSQLVQIMKDISLIPI